MCSVEPGPGLLGRRKSPQNTIASMTGIEIIISIVFTGVTPSEMRPAYEREPKTPAPPVPEDHVDTTFLKKNNLFEMQFVTYNISYLLNCAEYARKDASPRPELSDVNTTPVSAITSELE